MTKHFPNIEAFYAEDPRRERSPEADYGVQWRNIEAFPTWRVSYIQATGEVYAVELSAEARVEVLGVVTPDPVGINNALYYATLERVLAGWATACGFNGLAWVRLRVASWERVERMALQRMPLPGRTEPATAQEIADYLAEEAWQNEQANESYKRWSDDAYDRAQNEPPNDEQAEEAYRGMLAHPPEQRSDLPW